MQEKTQVCGTLPVCRKGAAKPRKAASGSLPPAESQVGGRALAHSGHPRSGRSGLGNVAVAFCLQSTENTGEDVLGALQPQEGYLHPCLCLESAHHPLPPFTPPPGGGGTQPVLNEGVSGRGWWVTASQDQAPGDSAADKTEPDPKEGLTLQGPQTGIIKECGWCNRASVLKAWAAQGAESRGAHLGQCGGGAQNGKSQLSSSSRV